MKKLCKFYLTCMLSGMLLYSLTACGMSKPSDVPIIEASDNPEIATAGIELTNKGQENIVEKPVSYSIYEPFGLQYDQGTSELTFENEVVRYFYDGAKISDDKVTIYCEYLNEKGTVDIYAIRELTENEDGSINLFGKLTGIERYSQEEFNQRDLSKLNDVSVEAAYSSGNNDPTARTFTEIFEVYKEFGIEYVEAQNVSGRGNVYYNGQLVNIFIDNNGTFSFHSVDGGEIKVQTIYDKNGKLIGVEEVN